MLELLEGGGGRLRLGPPRRHATDFDDSDDDLPDLTVVAPNGDGAALGAPVAASGDQAVAPESAAPAATPATPATLPFAPSAATPTVDPALPDEADEATAIFSWRPLSSGSGADDDVDPA